MTTAERQPDTHLAPAPWYRPTPQRFVLGLLIVELFLFLSERMELFSFNRQKGVTVLLALVVLALASLVLLLWYVDSLYYRRRFQFSLRSLLLFTVVVAMPCSWFATELHAARRQRAAVIAITEEHNATCGYVINANRNEARLGYSFNEEYYGYPLDADAYGYSIDGEEPVSLQHWLRDTYPLKEVLGEDFFVDVKWVTFRRPTTTDSALEHLEALPRLQWLTIRGTGISDAGLAHLRRLSRLRALWIDDDHLTDAGLVHLRELTRLKMLVLSGPGITDAGMENLEYLTKLRDLTINNSSVTDAGLGYLKRLKSLKSIELRGANVSERGKQDLLRHLPRCRDIATER